MQNSEFAYFSSKRGKLVKQMSNPPFWGEVGLKKVVSVFGFGRSHFRAPENAKNARFTKTCFQKKWRNPLCMYLGATLKKFKWIFDFDKF